MQTLRQCIIKLQRAIDIDDLDLFARAFSELVDYVGLAPAKAIAGALIAERRPDSRLAKVPLPVPCA